MPTQWKMSLIHFHSTNKETKGQRNRELTQLTGSPQNKASTFPLNRTVAKSMMIVITEILLSTKTGYSH